MYKCKVFIVGDLHSPEDRKVYKEVEAILSSLENIEILKIKKWFDAMVLAEQDDKQVKAEEFDGYFLWCLEIADAVVIISPITTKNNVSTFIGTVLGYAFSYGTDVVLYNHNKEAQLLNHLPLGVKMLHAHIQGVEELIEYDWCNMPTSQYRGGVDYPTEKMVRQDTDLQ